MYICNNQNSELCFPDIKIITLRNGGDLVNNLSCDSLFTELPPFLRDIISISKRPSLLFSVYSLKTLPSFVIYYFFNLRVQM